jgi:hypothetical protein
LRETGYRLRGGESKGLEIPRSLTVDSAPSKTCLSTARGLRVVYDKNGRHHSLGVPVHLQTRPRPTVLFQRGDLAPVFWRAAPLLEPAMLRSCIEERLFSEQKMIASSIT